MLLKYPSPVIYATKHFLEGVSTWVPKLSVSQSLDAQRADPVGGMGRRRGDHKAAAKLVKQGKGGGGQVEGS